MERDELVQLSKAELVELLLAQSAQLSTLQAALEKLQAVYTALQYKFEHNPKKPPPTSQNSSQPPSRDQKSQKSKHHGRRRKHGPPQGHEPHQRQLVATPDQVLEWHPQRCPACQTGFSQPGGQLAKVNQITELPPTSAQVVEVRQYQAACRHCGQSVVAQPPAGLEMERTYGARLEATVVYLRQEQHLSYRRTQETMRLLYGVDISQGGIDHIMQRAGQQALAQVPRIQAAVTSAPVIHCDETGCRVQVQAEVWVSDCHSAQLKAPSQARQLCLAHQHHNLQALVDTCPHLLWPLEMQALFHHAIHLQHQRHNLSPEAYQQQVARVESICDRLLYRPNAPPEIGKLLRRYQKHRQSLFVFLYRTDVAPTSNVAEQALRHSVVHRKVTNGFRSGWGARAYAAIASVIHTAERSGDNAFQAILSLFGPPALPLPARSE